MHASDLNNSVLKFDNYMSWAVLITQEFYNQFLAETEKGYPVTGFFQYKNLEAFYKSQVFFLSVVVSPLFKKVDEIFDTNYMDNLNQNVEILKQKVQEAAANNPSG